MQLSATHGPEGHRRSTRALRWRELAAGDVRILVVRSPRLDAALAPELADLLARTARPTVSELVLDLRFVQVMDASALAAIVYAFQAMQPELSLAAPNAQVRRLLRSTDLDRLFDVFPTAASAVHHRHESAGRHPDEHPGGPVGVGCRAPDG